MTWDKTKSNCNIGPSSSEDEDGDVTPVTNQDVVEIADDDHDVDDDVTSIQKDGEEVKSEEVVDDVTSIQKIVVDDVTSIQKIVVDDVTSSEDEDNDSIAREVLGNTVLSQVEVHQPIPELDSDSDSDSEAEVRGKKMSESESESDAKSVDSGGSKYIDPVHPDNGRFMIESVDN